MFALNPVTPVPLTVKFLSVASEASGSGEALAKIVTAFPSLRIRSAFVCIPDCAPVIPTELFETKPHEYVDPFGALLETLQVRDKVTRTHLKNSF